MAFTDHERMIPEAEKHTNFMMTRCPFGVKKPKAENLLKTKDQKKGFSCAKAENILKISDLQDIQKMEFGAGKLS